MMKCRTLLCTSKVAYLHVSAARSRILPSSPPPDPSRILSHIQLGTPEIAISLYNSAKEPTSKLLNLTVRSLSHHNFHTHLLLFFASLPGRPSCDGFTFPPLIKACAGVDPPSLLTGKEIHCQVLRSGFEGNVVVQTALVDMYAKYGDVGVARKVFDGMPRRDLVSWNALIYGYSSNGLDCKALETFQQMVFCGLRPNASTLVSVIPVCTRMVAVDAGRSLHCLAVRSGIVSARSLTPTLISMYAASGRVADAELLFEELHEQKDVVAFNAMISTYARNGKHEEAFEMFKKMLHSRVTPHLISFVSLLPVCSNLLNHSYGESIHAIVIKYGFVDKVPIDTSLISMYAKVGNLDAAWFLFDEMPEKNLLAWNSMVSGFVSNGNLDLALDTFVEMQLEGMMPDAVSTVSVVSACGELKVLSLGRSVHAFCLRNGFESHQNVMNALMAMYIDCEQLFISLKLFQKMLYKNLTSWNTLISGSAKLGELELAVALFSQMQNESVGFDIVTLISILPVLGRVGNVGRCRSFHSYAIKAGYCLDTSLGNALLSMFMNCGDLEAACCLFDSMVFKDVVSWNAIMTGFRSSGLDFEVMSLFDQMMVCGGMPNKITLLNIIPTCKSLLTGKSVHGYALRNFCILEDTLLTSIMCMYSKFENINSCLSLFQIANKRNIVIWNTLMSIFVQNQHVERVIFYFRQLLNLRLEPDEVTILNLVSAGAQSGCTDVAQNLTAYVVKEGFEKTLTISNALIDMLARCGDISMARGIFSSITNRDLVSWSTMINGYGMHGKGEAALALFVEMKEAGMKPDGVTFLSLLSACSHSGLVDQGRNIFKSMKENYHLLPSQEHFACMVDLLGRTGHLLEAYDFMKRSHFKPTSSMLESLLGACNSYSNLELGEVLGRLLLESESCSSSFVMLSKIYAGAGRWLDSSSLRSDMEARGFRKESGFSLIAINT